MKLPRFSPIVILALCFSNLRAGDVLSYHNDVASTGQNLTETRITPANLTVSNFAKRFSTTMDGQVYAQPLYKAGVVVMSGANAGTHDLVFVATQHDSLYALDANSGAIVWQTSFLSSGLAGATSITPMPSGDTGSSDITVEVGICGTPVIDPATNYLYLAAKTKQIVNSVTTSPHYVYTLHKIDITNGNATPNANIAGSLVIADTVNVNGANTYTHRTNASALAVQDPYSVGTGYSGEAVSLGGQSRVYFNAQRQMNRPGLVLYNGNIYIAFASHGDNGPYHGWLLSYNKTTLALTGALNTTPNGGLGGIWQGGGIPAMDASGNFYFETGNGDFNAGTAIGTFPTDGNYGDCFVKVSLDATTTAASQNKNGWGLKVADFFSPFNNVSLNNADRDLGSGGCVVLPDSAGNATYPHLLIGAGKEGKIYLINRDGMGKFDSATDHVIQTQAYSTGTPHMGVNSSFGTPAFYNGTLYYVGSGDNGKTFAVANAAFSTSVVKETPDGFAFTGSTPSISANGATNGVVWTLDRGSNQLRAYAASDFSVELWTSAQAGGGRDTLGSVVKFSVPTVADGHVFVGTSSALVACGPPAPPTAPPAAPTVLTATPFSGIEIDLAWTDTSNNEDGFKIEQSPDGSTFTEIATVGVNSTSYAVTGLQVSTPYYFRVRAYNSFNTLSYSGYANIASAVTSGLTPTIDFSNGFASAASSFNFVSGASINGTRLRITDSGFGEGRAAWTKNAQSVAKFTTQFTFQITAGSGFADGFTFCLQRAGNTTTVGTGGGYLGYIGIGTSVAIKFDTYPGVSTTGLYTNGADPNDNAPASIDMSAAGIDLHSGHVFSVALAYNGTTLTERVSDNSTNAVFTQTYTVNIPTTIGSSTAFLGFTGGTGGETTTQDILTWIYSIPPSSPPADPSGLTATPASGTQINLAWTDTATNEAGFKIERKAGAAGTYAQIGVTGANIAIFNDSGLTGGIDYYYRVRATNAAGDSAYAPETHALTPLPPVTPVNAHTTLVTSTQINLAWTDLADNEAGYKVLRKNGLASTFSEVASLPPNTTSFNNTGLSPGVFYDYHVQAYNLAGYSDFAGTTVQTLPTVSIAATDVTAQEFTTNTATFTFSRAGETTGSLNVAFTISAGAGQAARNVRYTLSPDSPVTIPAGSSSVDVTATPLNDPEVLGTQSIALSLAADSAYEFGVSTSATASLLDSPFNTWKIAEFGSLAAAQAPSAADSANPAGDGISNLEKYALGLHALTLYPPGTAGLPAINLDSSLGNRLTLTFFRPRPAPADVSYIIESTADLTIGTWIPLTLESGYPLNNGNGTETLKADDTQTTGTALQHFIRLRINRP